MKKSLYIIALSMTALILNSCSTMTPTDRIAENPHLYQTVPENERALVQSGEIRNGMNKNAVFLAWGAPNSPHVTGQNKTHSFVKWNYLRQTPIVNYNSAPYYYMDPYHHNRDYNNSYNIFMNNNISYIDKIYASVTFINGKVSSWEK